MMIFGNRLYGKVDQVPGLFHVATQFFHLNYVPLIPTGSYLVLEQSWAAGSPWMAVGWSVKSIVFAWGRAGLIVGAIYAGCKSIPLALMDLSKNGDWLTPALLLALVSALFYLFYVSYRFAHAGPARALWLAEQAGISMEALADYYAAANVKLPSAEAEDVPIAGG
jgi:hypothetical protein